MFEDFLKDHGIMSTPLVTGALGVSHVTLLKLVREGEFPEPAFRAPGRNGMKFWRAEDVETALQRREARSRSRARAVR
jgi:hypothetical protein